MQDMKGIDIEKIMEEIRKEIAEKKYTEDALDFDTFIAEQLLNESGDFNLKGFADYIYFMNTHWDVQAYRILQPASGLKGKLVVFIKKIIRKSTKFYVEPIIAEQNQFNANIANGFNEIRNFIKEVRKENEELKERIHALEHVVESLEANK